MPRRVKPSVAKKRGKGRRRSGRKMGDVEKVVRAVQGAALAGVAIYKVVKPHLHKLKRKPKKLNQ